MKKYFHIRVANSVNYNTLKIIPTSFNRMPLSQAAPLPSTGCKAAQLINCYSVTALKLTTTITNSEMHVVSLRQFQRVMEKSGKSKLGQCLH